jgi:hypothetical protein
MSGSHGALKVKGTISGNAMNETFLFPQMALRQIHHRSADEIRLKPRSVQEFIVVQRRVITVILEVAGDSPDDLRRNIGGIVDVYETAL